MRTEDAALQVMREQNRPRIWAGDPDLVLDVADKAGHKPGHPINRIAAVMSALAKSKKFKRVGRIEHMGHRYPVLEPIA